MRQRSNAPKSRPVRHDLVQATALEVYASVRQEGRLADRALDRVLRRERRLYSNERRAVAEGVWGLLRHERRIDFALFGRGAPTLHGVDLYRARWAGLAVLEGQAAAQIASAMHLPSSLVPLLERLALPLPEGLSAVERVALTGALPDFGAELFIRERGEAEALELATAFLARAPLTVRANLLKAADREQLREALSKEGLRTPPATRYSPLGLVLESRVNAFGLRAFQEGLFEIQDEGSQLLALLVQAAPGEQVVDACAGAGGKTLALCAEMRNKGELYAFDVDAERLQELSRRARRAGAHNVRTRALPEGDEADARISSMVGKVDRVLVDAPCSGLGALRRNPDARYRFKPDDLARYPALQKAILDRFARLVRVGGRVVYATCSLARAEDEAVVESFLALRPYFRLVPAAQIVPAEVCEGPYLRTFPHRHGTDGFFAAVMERVG